MLRRTCTFVAAAALATACFLPTSLAAEAEREFPDNAYFYDSKESAEKGLDKLVGKPAPELQVSDWHGKQVTAADIKGKVVIVDIWATWCGPCIASIPHNNELVKKHGAEGLVIVGVCSSANGQEKMAAVAEAKKMGYPTAKDPGGKTAKAYGVQFYPTYIAIDRKGVVRAVGLRPTGVDQVVKKLLAEKA